MNRNTLRNFLLAVPVLLAGSFLMAQPVPVPLPGPPRPAPAAPSKAEKGGLEFKETTKNFGEAEEGETVVVKFPFMNKSEETITITDVRSSCGCTAAAPDKKVFEPGEGGEITAKFNTRNRMGNQHKVITVITDENTYQVRLEGEVITDVYLQPRSVNFGNVEEGESATRKIEFINLGEEDIIIESAEDSRDVVKVELGEKEEFTHPGNGRKGTKIPITITLPDDAPAGNLTTSIRIRTNSSAQQIYNAIIRGQVLGEVNVQPSVLAFSVLQPGESRQRTGQIIIRGENGFAMDDYRVELENLTSSADDMTTPTFEIELDDRTKNSSVQPLKVTLEAPDTFGHIRGTLILDGKAGEKELEVPVPFTAFVRKDNPRASAPDNKPQPQDVDREKVLKLIEEARKAKAEKDGS